MDIRVLDTIEAFKRRFAVVIIDERYITMMYCSSGSAGAKGWWFPFCGLKTTIEYNFNDVAEWFNNDYGWIVKQMWVYDILDGKRQLSDDMSKGNHRNPYLRLSPKEDMSVDFFELSVYLMSNIDTLPCKYPKETLGKYGISESGINVWLKDIVYKTIKEVKNK